MNLAQFLNNIYNDIGSDTNRFPIALLKDWIDEAQRRIIKTTKCIRKESNVTAVTSQRLYDYPTDILDHFIDKVFYAYTSDNNDKTELVKSDLTKIAAYDTAFLTTTGDPEWFFNDEENNQWGLYPYPSSLTGSGTNKILMKYRGKHTKMTRYYITGTVSITRGTTAVTGSGTAFDTNVVAGDYIGIGRLLNNTTAFPITWYEIESVDSSTGLTLTSNFNDPSSASSAYYIIAQDSSITNDEINQACCDYVLGKCFIKDKEYNLGNDYKDLALQRAILEQNSFDNSGGKTQISIPKGGMKPQAISGLHDYGSR